MREMLKKILRETALNYRIILLIALVLVLILIVYWQDFSILANEAARNEELNHAVLIPFLLSYVIYRKRAIIIGYVKSEKILKAPKWFPFLNEIAGLALILSAFLLYWYGSYTFYALEYHIFSIPLFLAGTVLFLFDLKMLHALIFPLLFILFLIPPPSAINYEVGAVLGNFNTQASYTILRIFGLPITLQSAYGSPTIAINTPSGTPILFSIGLPCSGIYSLIAFAMFATFLVFISRGSIAKKLILFPAGFLLLTALNILRISLLVSIAYQFGEVIAMTVFHTISGWMLIFTGMILLLIMSEKFLHLRILEAERKTKSCLECGNSEKSSSDFCLYCGGFLKRSLEQPPKKIWAKLLALLLVSYLITLSIQAPVFSFAQGLTFTNSEASREAFPQVPGYRMEFLYRDQNYEEVADQDASLVYAYISQNVSNPTVYVLVGVADSIFDLHSWEVCFVTLQTSQGKPPFANVLESRDIQLMQNPPIIANYLTFQHPDNYTQITLYWFQKALFKTATTIESKYARISLVILTRNLENSAKFEQTLRSLGQSITEFWEPLKTQSLVSLGIPTIQVMLGLTLLIAVLTPATQYTKEWRRKVTSLKIFEKMASSKEKTLYKTIEELSRQTKETTTQNISYIFEKSIVEEVKSGELMALLSQLEESGIIRQDITNINGQPKLVWKV